MKKIMFNDKIGLTQAVLDGRKTQTRRLASPFLPDAVRIGYARFEIANGRELRCWTKGNSFIKYNLPYKVGSVVAIAQKYEEVLSTPMEFRKGTGWKNKMFVSADLMPHRIRITNVRLERLQDISDEDCLKEGIIKGRCGSEGTHFMDAYYVPSDIQPYCTPREAFAHLIDKVSRKGTWESNPYVFVYDFELVKGIKDENPIH